MPLGEKSELWRMMGNGKDVPNWAGFMAN